MTTLDEELVAIRRDIHAHPELGRAERRTTALVAARLARAGLSPRVLKDGVGLICDVGSGDPVVALRADLDALPLADEKEVPYRSVVPGACHACGHDVHTTVLLGAGLSLGEVAGTVRLVFQPAEEVIPGGAHDVVDQGGLDGVRAIFALHCDPRREVGRVGVSSGPISAATDLVEIALTGPGGHTARPHLTADLVYVLGLLVTEVPAALSRLVDPRSGLSLVFGAAHAGTAPNAIPREGSLRGTLRVFDHAAWTAAPSLVERVVAAVAEPYGVRAGLTYTRGVPPVVNDATATAVLAAAAAAALGPDAVVPTERSLGGEDFSWYLEHVPGALARLGVGIGADLHSGRFDVDERAIGVGVKLLVAVAHEALRRYA